MVNRTISLVLVLAVFLQSACVSSTVITSIPDHAKVYVDGQLMGKAPVTHKDTAILGSSKTVVLKLDGYHNTVGTIRKEEIQAGPLVAGILFIIPLLWLMGYPSQYIFELEPEPQVPQVLPSPPSS